MNCNAKGQHTANKKKEYKSTTLAFRNNIEKTKAHSE